MTILFLIHFWCIWCSFFVAFDPTLKCTLFFSFSLLLKITKDFLQQFSSNTVLP